MKKLLVITVVSAIFIWSTCTHAFVSGSTGVDGAFNPTVNTTVTLPPGGVLNYTTVNIPAGVTVTFQKNAANTPVYMLATGDVTIAGTISVNGGHGTPSIAGVGGPGGYDGGSGGATNSEGGNGLGPGGGSRGKNNSGGGGGGYGTNGENGVNYSGWTPVGGTAYGSATLLPLCGGSGGGGGSGFSQPGGGGGGAIMIASSTSINLTGSITSTGGNGSYGCYNCGDGAGGSGGAIRLVSNLISGNGTISAAGGVKRDRSGGGGKGRIRIEATTNQRTASTDPPYSYGVPGNVFISNSPVLSISMVGGVSPPAPPTGNYNQPDVLLPGTTTNPVAVNISAANIPVGTTVKVRVIPQYGADSSVNTTLSGTDQSSTASANVTLSTTYSNIVTAEATFTVVAVFYNGEQIDKVHVAATMGGKSETTYITKSGKTIKGDLVAFAR